MITNQLSERCGVLRSAERLLFYGSDKGGERAATAYTLLEIAKLNDINPQAYLTWEFEAFADHPTNRIDELLPWNFSDNQQKEAA